MRKLQLREVRALPSMVELGVQPRPFMPGSRAVALGQAHQLGVRASGLEAASPVGCPPPPSLWWVGKSALNWDSKGECPQGKPTRSEGCFPHVFFWLPRPGILLLFCFLEMPDGRTASVQKADWVGIKGTRQRGLIQAGLGGAEPHKLSPSSVFPPTLGRWDLETFSLMTWVSRFCAGLV